MTFDLKRIALGVAVAALLMAVLAKLSGVGLSDFANISPAYAVMALLFSMATIALRAANYRAIGNQYVAASLRGWLQVSLRHQFLFTAVPSGLGDIGFPVLARQYVGLDLKQGAATIAMARLRDLCFLPALGCGGLAVLGYAPVLSSLAALALGAAGLMAEQLVGLLRRSFQRLRAKVPPSQDVGQQTFTSQLIRSALTIGSWTSAALALWCAYASAGFVLDPAASFVMLAGLNAIGIIAISVGGLGVAEAGSTGVLTFLAVPLEQAAQVSLVARPVFLVAVLAACAVLWAASRLTDKSHAPAPQS